MSLYLRRIEGIMDEHDCDASEAVEIMKVEFAHEDIPVEDEADRILSDYGDE